MLEKNFTRNDDLIDKRNERYGLPKLDELRPEVRQIKKRANLLLKGHSNDLSASYGSNHQSVFKKANDKLAGDVEITFSYDRRLAASLNNSFQKKIQ